MNEDEAKKKAQGSMWGAGEFDTRYISRDGRVAITSALGSIRVYTDPRLAKVNSNAQLEAAMAMEQRRDAMAYKKALQAELARKGMRLCDACGKAKPVKQFTQTRHRCNACRRMAEKLRGFERVLK